MMRSFTGGFLSSAPSSSKKSKDPFDLEPQSLPFYLLRQKLEKIRITIGEVGEKFDMTHLRIDSSLDQLFSDSHLIHNLGFDMAVT